MKVKEKAKELVDKYQQLWGSKMHRPYAKQCALIAVDEIIEVASCIYDYDAKVLVPYWESVKQEIKKL